jgi:CBS-domain-containing membrane protein
LDLELTEVGDIASTGVVWWCSSNDGIDDAARLMATLNVRRLLVADADNNPVGIISLGDLACRKPGPVVATGTLRALRQAGNKTAETTVHPQTTGASHA